MRRAAARCAAWCAVTSGVLAPPVLALELPPTCRTQTPPAAAAPQVSIEALRRQVETLAEDDPDAAVRIMCATIPRVEREKGPRSPELAWWAISLATPLIAYLNRFDEAIPLLQFAQPILEKQNGGYTAELADLHVAYGWIYLRQGRLADSANEWTAALRIRERVPGAGRVELQKVLVGLAQVRLSQRDFPATHALLDRANVILQEDHATVSEAAAAIENLLTNLAVREEDYAAARGHAQAQIAIERQLNGGAPQLVPAYVLLGRILEHLDDFAGSEAALREAIRLTESDHGPLQRHLLVALNQIAVLLNDRDRPAEAEPFARRAVAVGTQTLGADAPRLVGMLDTLASIRWSQGDLPEALHLYERGTAIVVAHRADVERQVLVAHYRGVGGLELTLGDRDAARAALQTALDAAGDDPTLAEERAFVLLALARTTADGSVQVRDLDESLRLFRTRLPATHPLVLRVINELCAAETASSPASAPRCTEAAEWVARAHDIEPSLRAAVYANQSRLASERGDSESAFQDAVRGLAAAEGVATPEPLWRAQFRLATLLQQRGAADLAVFFGKSAVAQIENLRGYFVGDDRRFDSGFLADKIAVYRAVADWLMELGRIDEGLEVLRLLKRQELLDFTLRAAPAEPIDSTVSLTAHEQSLQQQYLSGVGQQAAERQELERLARLKRAERIAPGESARLNALVTVADDAEAARAQHIREFVAGGSGSTANVVSSRSVQALQLTRELRRFGPDTAVGVYLLTEHGLRILVATHLSQEEYRVPIDAAQLRQQIGSFLAALSRREPIADRAAALYRELAQPLDQAAQRAHARRIVLWLDDALRYVPFAALNDGTRDLVERYSFQSYSAVTAAPASPKQNLSVRGLGVTRAVGGFEALPAMADELCDVVHGPIRGLERRGDSCPKPGVGAGALPGEGFADGEFTELRLREVLQNPSSFSVLHIGTHFSLRPGNSLRSFLVLGDGARLTLESISGLDFSGISLITLSACQTGLGAAVGDDGREIDGLSAIVQRRGARQVIASLWEVEDRGTALMMRSLYRQLSAGDGDAALALQRAQLSLRSATVGGRTPYRHPYYWAGFVASVD
jgi:CHAT domain-containing protein/tetratricopeptide (TPR) repeat protein